MSNMYFISQMIFKKFKGSWIIGFLGTWWKVEMPDLQAESLSADELTGSLLRDLVHSFCDDQSSQLSSFSKSFIVFRIRIEISEESSLRHRQEK